jgi:hypothetical protein
MKVPEQPELSRQRSFRGAQCAAALSIISGLLSIAMNLYPVGLVFLLESWLGDFLPLFLPFLVGALALGLAVLSLVRAPRLSWLAIIGLVFGAIGMAFGTLVAVVTAYAWVRTGGGASN